MGKQKNSEFNKFEIFCNFPSKNFNGGGKTEKSRLHVCENERINKR